MPRRKRMSAKSKEALPDIVYQSPVIRRFINMLMHHGKYQLAARNVYQAIDIVLAKTEGSLVPEAKREAVNNLFESLIQKAGPDVEVKSKRLGGATYPVPTVVNTRRRMTLAFRWLIRYARKRKGAICESLAYEFLDVLSGRGGASNERENMHRMARANMAFANIKKEG